MQAGSPGAHSFAPSEVHQRTPPDPQHWPEKVQLAPLGVQDSQVQDPPLQRSPVPGSAQVRPVQQPAWLVQEPLTIAQDWQLPALHTSPKQQVAPGALQSPPEGAQESQTHPRPPPVHSAPSGPTQESPSQQPLELVGALHDWSCGVQVGGTAHFPAMHCSVGALQQSELSEHAPAVGAQVLAEVQVPLVAPPGMAQPRPLQQSASAVQVPLAPTQGAAQVPSLQLLEQH